MEKISLEAAARTVSGKKVKRLRLEGKLPAVVYGHGFENQAIELDRKVFEKAYSQSGDSTLISLAVDGGEAKNVLVHDVQYNPITNVVAHVDFRQVNMKEKLEADVALNFTGESNAVKAHGAILVRNMDALAVSCLPSDLVHEIEIDLGKLENIDDSIKVGDVTAPKGVEFLAQPEEIIIVASAPMSEEEEAALEAENSADASTVKVEGEEKKEEAAEEEKK